MNFLEENQFIIVKDHSVSKETFSLLHNKEYDLLKTHPTPSLDVLGKYYESEDYISHTDGKRTFFEKIYHLVKRSAIKGKVSLITSEQPQKGKLLDIGSGTGDFLVEAKHQGWDILGFEPNKDAKNLAVNKGVTFTEDIFNLPENSFDVVTMWHVLEHVPNLEEYIANLKCIIKPTGTIIIAVPNYKSYDAKYYNRFWAAYDVPRHLWHFSKTSIKRLFSDVDMELKNVKPMWFDSFYVSLLSEKYKTGKMSFVKGFFIGLMSNVSGLFKKEFSSHIYIIKNQ
ncbi:class I SAM-dependent methyltransferase [Flavobacterium urocaniciphilum]|uniref:Methyltransferase domain-containing protein n=1 Tax=Flavobacterium urocaniciphilum TaxID=1299341 RepID=A0A1H9BUH2_9FLAO|nr:class I SAM-dependent methyltransferase [Flavobacterium urocaniciphilum]SEP92233.1 Methyltransferase domain-containing protein [Flavobacterium urocaniciphilum]